MFCIADELTADRHSLQVAGRLRLAALEEKRKFAAIGDIEDEFLRLPRSLLVTES